MVIIHVLHKLISFPRENVDMANCFLTFVTRAQNTNWLIETPNKSTFHRQIQKI